MPDMTNAEAAKVLNYLIDKHFLEDDWREAFKTALAALTAPAAPAWIRTADRLPEEKDGKDFLTHDIAWHREGESAFSVISLADLLYYRGDEYDYWMPLPPLPEVDT